MSFYKKFKEISIFKLSFEFILRFFGVSLIFVINHSKLLEIKFALKNMEKIQIFN